MPATAAVGGAVVGEHVHPRLQERFRVISGRIGVRLGGTRVLVGLSPPDPRFETMIATMYGPANASLAIRSH